MTSANTTSVGQSGDRSAGNLPLRQYRGRMARNMLFVLLPLSLIPLVALGSMAYLYSRDFLLQQASSLLATVAETQSNRIISQVETGELLISRALVDENIASTLDEALSLKIGDPQFTAARNNAFDSLQSVNRPKPFYNQFIVVKPDGVIHLSTQREWQGQAIHDEAYFELADLVSANMAPSSRAGFAFEPLYAGEDKILSFVIMTAVPYLDQQDDLAAIVIGISESVAIRDFINNALFYSDQGHFVTAQGEFIALNPYTDSMSNLLLMPATQAQTQTYLSNLSSAAAVSKQLDSSVYIHHEPVLIAHTWMEELNIAWAVEVLQADVYGEIEALLLYGLAILVGLLLVVGLAIGLLTRNLTRPLLELSDTVHLFAQGKWEQRSKVKRHDEVGLLADSFDQMAADLSQVYLQLETQVEERTVELDTLATLSKLAISSANLDELLSNTLELVIYSFHCQYGAVYLAEEAEIGGRQFATLRQARGQAAIEKRFIQRRISIDPSPQNASLAGRVIAAKRSHNKILKSASAELDGAVQAPPLFEYAFPIVVGDQVLGALDLYTFGKGLPKQGGPEDEPTDQSAPQNPISDRVVAELQTLTNQIAAAVQNFQLLEATQINLQEANLIYQAGHQIAQADNIEQALYFAGEALKQSSYKAALLLGEGDRLSTVDFETAGNNNYPQTISAKESISAKKSISQEIALPHLPSALPIVVNDLNSSQLPRELVDIPKMMGSASAAFLPVLRGNSVAALLVLGAAESGDRPAAPLNAARLQPYANLVELVTSTIEKLRAESGTQKRLNEMQTLWTISQAISLETDLSPLYRVIHKQVTESMGELDSFAIGIYDQESNFIHFPYMVEKGEPLEITPFQLGQGLTSVVIQSGRPLRLNEDAARKTAELGALTVGEPAKSWLGVPLQYAGQVIGVILAQDIDHEGRFSEEDERLLLTLAAQIALVIRNARLLESSRKQAEIERLVNEITAKIRRSTDIRGILKTTADELAAALGARRAHIRIQTAPEAAHAHKPGASGNGANRPENGV